MSDGTKSTGTSGTGQSAVTDQASRMAALDWSKSRGLLPAIVQDADSGRVLMLGYMNPESLERTLKSGRVTFFSRSRQCLWTKGETSGNWLSLVSVHADCDVDSLLVLARPEGPTCHLGTESCFDTAVSADGDQAIPRPRAAVLAGLDRLIGQRHAERPADSYTTRLFEAGALRMAQKVGEEGVECALAAVAEGESLEQEAADLLYHLLVLLHGTGHDLGAVMDVLEQRAAD